GEMADEPDSERAIGQRTSEPDLVDEPVDAADRRATDEPQTARLGDRSGESTGGVAASHGCIEDRVFDAEQITQPRMQRHGDEVWSVRASSTTSGCSGAASARRAVCSAMQPA